MVDGDEKGPKSKFKLLSKMSFGHLRNRAASVGATGKNEYEIKPLIDQISEHDPSLAADLRKKTDEAGLNISDIEREVHLKELTHDEKNNMIDTDNGIAEAVARFGAKADLSKPGAKEKHEKHMEVLKVLMLVRIQNNYYDSPLLAGTLGLNSVAGAHSPSSSSSSSMNPNLIKPSLFGNALPSSLRLNKDHHLHDSDAHSDTEVLDTKPSALLAAAALRPHPVGKSVSSDAGEIVVNQDKIDGSYKGPNNINISGKSYSTKTDIDGGAPPNKGNKHLVRKGTFSLGGNRSGGNPAEEREYAEREEFADEYNLSYGIKETENAFCLPKEYIPLADIAEESFIDWWRKTSGMHTVEQWLTRDYRSRMEDRSKYSKTHPGWTPLLLVKSPVEIACMVRERIESFSLYSMFLLSSAVILLLAGKNGGSPENICPSSGSLINNNSGDNVPNNSTTVASTNTPAALFSLSNVDQAACVDASTAFIQRRVFIYALSIAALLFAIAILLGLQVRGALDECARDADIVRLFSEGHGYEAVHRMELSFFFGLGFLFVTLFAALWAQLSLVDAIIVAAVVLVTIFVVWNS